MHNFLLLILVLYSISFSKLKLEIPPCIQNFVNNYVADSTGEGGFLYMKKVCWDYIDHSITSNEIEADLPIKEYMFDYEKIDTCSDTLPVEELIKPTGRWILPVKARGIYIYQVFIRKTKDSCISIGNSTLNYDLYWGDLRKKYPPSYGDNPILISDFTSQYLHFPKRGTRNLYFLDRKNFSGRSATHDLSSESDCKKYITSLKKRHKDAKPFRDELEKEHPGFVKKMRDLRRRGGEE